MSLKRISVEEEFKKNPELKQDMLDGLKDWLSKQPHLPQMSDLDIVIFLHCSSYSMEKAKTVIDSYYTIKTHAPEIFSSRLPSHPTVQNGMNIVDFFTLPGRTPNGDRVFVTRLRETDPAKYIYADATKTNCLLTDLELLENGTAKGDRMVFDMHGMVIGHLARLPLSTLRKYMFYLQDAQPLRLLGVHIINVTPFVNKFLAIINPFIKDELSNKLHIHSDMETFYDFVPKAMLPKEFGGNAPSCSEFRDESRKKVKDNVEYIAEEEKNKVNEMLRSGKGKTAGDLFGIEGSFKKLDID